MTDARLKIWSPAFGSMYLNERPLAEPPVGTVALGYVEIDGKPNQYALARFIRGEWRQVNGKPLPSPVNKWFQMEDADGLPTFQA